MSGADAMNDTQAPQLEHVATVVVDVGGRLFGGYPPLGGRGFTPIPGGRALGRGLGGMVVPGGADFQIIRSATFTDIHARYVIETSAGERVYVENTGIRTGSAEDIARLARGEAVDPARIYFRSYPRFETSSPTLGWMNESLFIGTGARYPDRVELRFYRIC